MILAVIVCIFILWASNTYLDKGYVYHKGDNGNVKVYYESPEHRELMERYGAK